MLISSCHVTNYKGFRESEELLFANGFNVIVGRNNVGKTALIEVLSLRAKESPHRSLETVKLPDSPIDPNTCVTITFEIEPVEFISIFGNAGVFNIPTRAGRTVAESANAFIGCMERQSRVRCRFVNGRLDSAEVEGFGSGFGAEKVGVKYDRKTERFTCVTNHMFSSSDHTQTFAPHLAAALMNRIYTFRAERLNLGEGGLGVNPELSGDARNLVEVLHLLQSTNPVRFRRLNQDVRTVFPDITQITVRPYDQSHGRILVWSISPETERDDLAIPLSDCGAGIGQVLAMLYVVTNSNHSRTIIIDEPQSFLHPGAIRKLFGIFRRNPQHQFIVSTHSPTVVTAANPRTLMLLRREGNETRSEVLSVNEASELRVFLAEVGARLSDVFGADSILWVEGRTEEICFRLIAEQLLKIELLGTEIIGLKHVGDFEGRHAKSIAEIYQRLCEGKGLLPPALAFLFDREDRTDAERNRLAEMSRGRIHFLPRRMYENYLLNPGCIAAVLAEADTGASVPVTAELVESWLTTNVTREAYITKEQEHDFTKNVNGAKLLRSAFNELSDTRVAFDKVKHGVKMTEWLIKNRPDDLQELALTIKEQLSGRSGVKD